MLNSAQQVQIYNPETPYQITNMGPTNPILQNWYGIENYQILAIEYGRYALVYSCVKSVFGLMTNGYFTVLTRASGQVSDPIDEYTRFRLDEIMKSFEYRGRRLVYVDQQSDICNF